MFQMLLSMLSFMLLLNCASQNEPSAQPTPNTAPNTTQGLRLKSVGMLAQSLYQTLGPKKNISQADRGEDLFATYSQNFGNTDGLRFGEVYADSPSTSYMLALAILGSNAAARCEDELKASSNSLCRCETTAAAKTMLSRAFPKLNFNDISRSELVDHFAEACKSNYRGAIASLVSSIAFAAR